jgi:hypothetical protein
MNERRTRNQQATYRICVRGILGQEWSERFADCATIERANGETVLVGTAVDGHALHGVLSRIRDLGLRVQYLQVAEAAPLRPD